MPLNDSYVLMVSVNSNDSPFKGHSLIYIHLVMCMLNLSVALAAIQKRDFGELGVFILTDWVIFLVRIVGVARAGSRQCPKLITLLVKNQLDNVPSPLPKFEEAVGAKSAMRCNQAFLSLSEGESMTMAYVFYMLFYTLLWAMLRENKILFMFQMRSMWVVVGLTLLDFAQDIMAEKVTHKFNNYTWLYKSGGWHTQKFVWFHAAFGCVCGCWFIQMIMMGIRMLNQHYTASIAAVDWAWPLSATVHY